MSGIKIRTGGAKGKKLTVGERREKNAQKKKPRRHGGTEGRGSKAKEASGLKIGIGLAIGRENTFHYLVLV